MQNHHGLSRVPFYFTQPRLSAMFLGLSRFYSSQWHILIEFLELSTDSPSLLEEKVMPEASQGWWGSTKPNQILETSDCFCAPLRLAFPGAVLRVLYLQVTQAHVSCPNTPTPFPVAHLCTFVPRKTIRIRHRMER